jgi:hypothetical protein
VISKCRASTSSNLSMVCQYSNKLYPNSNYNSNLPLFIFTFIVVNDTVVWRINFLIFIFRIQVFTWVSGVDLFLLDLSSPYTDHEGKILDGHLIVWIVWGKLKNCLVLAAGFHWKPSRFKWYLIFFLKTTHTTALLSKWKTGRYTTRPSFIANRRDLIIFRME